MLDWKQRLYAFLLRKVVGPFLDDSSANELHDSIDVSLQDGIFVLKDITMNAARLSDNFSSSGFSVTKATVQRLEIRLTLRENAGTYQSSLAWRAMKLGGTTEKESIPAVSLVAEVLIRGVDLEIEPIRATPVAEHELAAEEAVSDTSTRTRVRSYVEAAISSLQLTLRLSDINIRLWHSSSWLSVCLSSVTFKDGLSGQAAASDVKVTPKANKTIDFFDITVRVGGSKKEAVVALAKGNGRVFIKISEDKSALHRCPSLHHDVEASLNHQLNLSFDVSTLACLHAVATGFGNTRANGSRADVDFDLKAPESLTPGIAEDEEDLVAISGIMKQYHEAYHLAQTNKLRGGLLIPSHAYTDDSEMIEEDDAITFDVFWDAQEQSPHETNSTSPGSVLLGTANESAPVSTSQTKVRLSLLSVSVKISFRELRSQAGPHEYLLVTLDDIKVSLLNEGCRSALELTLGDFAIEDAQSVETDRNHASAQMDIGILFCFATASKQTETCPNQGIDLNAPCVSLYISRDNTGSRSIECTLQPLELTARQRSIHNLFLFVRSISESQGKNNAATAEMTNGSTVDARVMFSCHCPSVVLSLPVHGSGVTANLFDRCGETILDAPVKDSCLSLLLDTIELTWNRGDRTEDGRGVESAGKLTAWRVLGFASAPIGDHVVGGTAMKRMDLLLLNARTEVEPCIPISLDFKSVRPPSKEANDSFPLVPMISSFKARQKDEVGEVDQLMDSILGSTEQNSKIKRADPQIAMFTATEKSDAIVSIRIPEIICDLTKTELVKVKEMLEVMTVVGNDRVRDSEEGQSVDLTISVGLRIDQISLSLRQDFSEVRGDNCSEDRFSFLFAIDTFRAHLLVCGWSMQHIRLLFHDAAFYSAAHPGIEAQVPRAENNIQMRVLLMKQRILDYRKVTVSPIIYRSKLFTPICIDAPAFLLDVLDSSADVEGQARPSFVQKQISLTLYHLTFRYDPDSDWLDRLKDFLPKSTDPLPTQIEQTTSMTRVFVALADCSIDYISPSYFCTASRNVLRLGDVRCASNIMVPNSQRQAFSLSVGDLCCHVANERSSRAGEDVKLCRASSVFPRVPAPPERKSRVHGSNAEALLRDEGFVEILTLDAIDVVIVTTKETQPTDVEIAVDASFGLLSMSACKDSFRCFSASVGEIQAKITAMSDADIARVKQDIQSTKRSDSTGPSRVCPPLDDVMSEYGENFIHDECLLDGYEWTEVDHDPLREIAIPDGAEQVAAWYSTNGPRNTDNAPLVVPSTSQPRNFPTRIIHDHFPFHSLSNPLTHGKMGAEKYGGVGSSPQLRSRVVVHSLTVKLRFHDGYDWPRKVSDQERTSIRKDSQFVIAPPPKSEVAKIKAKIPDVSRGQLDDTRAANRVELLASLLDGDETGNDGRSPFDNAALPEDRARTLEEQSELRRLSKRNKVYLQVSSNGMTIKLDTYKQSEIHRLVSVLGVSISDMFIAEAASTSTPVKMLGEWINENEHPRDSRSGILMLKMITWSPEHILSADGEIQSDECEVTMQLLPMRAVIDQRAIQFARGFFHEEDAEDSQPNDWKKGLHLFPPPRFRTFSVKKWKLKVDYIPQKLDVDALRDGSIVELINLSPIDGMVIVLNQASVEDSVGFADVMGGLTGSWLQEIVSTQLYKFLANARPFEPISDVGQGITDLVVLPYEAFKNGDDIRRAVSSGMVSLAGTMAFQALTTTSRLTEYAASRMAALVGGRHQNLRPLPTRPTAAPKGVQDVTGHAIESLARGFQAANYKIVIVPYREYSRHGAVGAASSVLRGIPVMLVAPVTGATEALSYTLLGARNALRPDIRREEEASRTGFTSYDV